MTTTSLVLIVTAAARAQGDAYGEAFGRGPQTYTVPLAPTIDGPATHYGCHSWETDYPVAVLDAALAGTLNPLPPGILGAELQAHVAGLIRSDIADPNTDPAAHFESVLAANGLTRVIAPPPHG